MASKKGIIETQFNWIFILIAGAVILITFTGILMKQKNISADSADLSAANNFHSILASSEINSGIVDIINMPKAKIEFSCNKYSIGKASRQLKSINVFAPSVLDGDNIILETLGWNMPYRITTFVYLTNPSIKYIFVGENDFARKIFQMMPGETSSEGYTNSKAIQDIENNKVRLVFFNQNPEIPENNGGIKDGAITALKVVGDENYGTLEFFSLSEGTFKPIGESYYLNEPALFGAIFTDNIEAYSCAMKNAFDELNVISKIYQAKINKTRDAYYSLAEDDACRQFYDNLAQQISGDLDKLASSTFPEYNPYDIVNAATEIERKNNEAEEKSCVMIY